MRPFTRLSPGLRHMVAAAFYFSVMSVLVKTAGRSLPTMQLVLARGVISLVLAGAQLRVAGISPWGNRKGLLILRGMLGFVGLVCFYYAITHLPLAEATVIQYTNPVMAALLAGVLLRERPRLVEIVGVLGCLVGVVLVARPAFLFGAQASAGFAPLALAASVTGAVVSAFAYVLVRKLGETENHIVTVLYFPMVAVPATLPLWLPVAVWPTPVEAALMLAIGVVTHLAQLELTQSLQQERAGRALSMGYIQIVFAGLWGVLFFSEVPDGVSLLGACVIIACTVIVSRSAPQPHINPGEREVFKGPGA